MSVETGRSVLRQESRAIEFCAAQLGDAFDSAVKLLLSCVGRVVTCGVGKSGHIARKTAGTLSSTGTPSLFLHASEAVHGDLGMVTNRDVVLLYSHSGETDELVRLYPSLSAQGAKTILVTGRADSTAGRLSDVVLDTGVTEEACVNNLAPTTSTTVMLALSDALAIAVMERRGFSREDFARFHPSGTLGKRLLLHVADVMRQGAEIAAVSRSTTIRDVIQAMTTAGLGAACVLAEGKLVGLVSEGDLRRHLLTENPRLDIEAERIMNVHPATIEADLLATDAFEIFQNFPIKIGELPVVEGGRLVGLLVLKDLLRSGIV